MRKLNFGSVMALVVWMYHIVMVFTTTNPVAKAHFATSAWVAWGVFTVIATLGRSREER